MKTRFVKCSLVMMALLLGGVSFSAFASEDYLPPVSMQKNIFTYTIKQNGSYQEVRKSLILIENEEGVSNYGEEKIPYTPKLESLKILDAYTILPNGSRIKVPPESIRTIKGDMDSEAASYSDTQYKVIIYPKVVVGSQLYLEYTKTAHTPLFPGHFTLRQTFSPYIKYALFEINVNFDPRINIRFDSKGVDGGVLPDKGGMHRYRFTYRQDKIIPFELDKIDTDDYSPYVLATTFADYGAIGAAYQKKSKQKVRVTRDIRKLANELTTGVDTKREQARILYNWVSKNIRYVGSYMGNGGYVPHDSQTILDNRWGDCKDHVVILEALLAAKGIASSPALINTGHTYVLPKLAAPVFDHVITYVPSLDLYLDSTAQFAPFGRLPSSDLHKQVVLTGLNKLSNTPPMLANENVARTSIQLKVMPDGRIQGASKVETSGDSEIALRRRQFSNQGMPQLEVVKNMLRKNNLTGVGEVHSSDPNDLNKPLEVSATFTLDPVSNFPGPAAMLIPAGIDFEVITADMLPKPKDKFGLPERCESFVYSNHYDIEFPINIKITHVPENVRYSDDTGQYTATYRLTGNKLVIDRELFVQHPTMVCGQDENEMDKKFFPIFQRDMRAQVIYE
ncbi:MAG TPA: DUF3857 and transglutaminase domain-containing protein [Gallionella sp.]|nr:DUF3857 and transglutaminase domain-containing protein [Gallionella sp.]